MKASKFTDAQKAFILKHGADGHPVAEICRKAGIDQATYFNGKKKYDGLLPDEMRRLKCADLPLPDAEKSLDANLKVRGLLHHDAPMFVCETTGELWSENYLNRIHRQIRKAAGLRFELQLQDFRRTGQTEPGAAGATVDEIRAIARHTTRDAGEHHVHPDSRLWSGLFGRNRNSAPQSTFLTSSHLTHPLRHPEVQSIPQNATRLRGPL